MFVTVATDMIAEGAVFGTAVVVRTVASSQSSQSQQSSQSGTGLFGIDRNRTG